MGNSPGFSFLLSETPPAVQPEPVRPSTAAAHPSGDRAPAVRKVQFPTRLAQSVSDQPPGARLTEFDDIPPEDLPIQRLPEPEPRDALTKVGNLSAALLSRLRPNRDEPALDEEPSFGAPRRETTASRPARAAHLPRTSGARTGGTFARALWGKARSPLAALLVAGVFYVGGTELIGRTQIALSKPAVPAIPELGTLEATKGDAQSRTRSQGDEPEAGEGEAATTEAASRERAPLTTELVDLPAGLSWPGKGLVEVVTPEDELIYVDGVFIGRGPLRRIPLAPGEHEVWIQKDALRQVGKVQVVLDRSVRAVFAFR